MRPDVSAEVFEHVEISGLPAVAKAMVEDAGHVNVWLFSGEMGSGKTTLIKEIGKALGVTDVMHSPTFSIVNEYKTNSGKLFHFDFYRMKSETEAYDIGLEEYIYSGHYCLMEWPEKIPSLIPDMYAEVKILIENNTQRTIAVSVHDREEKNRI